MLSANGPAQEPSPPITRNSSTSFEPAIKSTSTSTSIITKHTSLKRNLSQRVERVNSGLVRSKSKIVTRTSSLRYQLFSSKSIRDHQIKTKWESLILQSSRPKPKGPRPHPSNWIAFLAREINPVNHSSVGDALKLVRNGSVRALGRGARETSKPVKRYSSVRGSAKNPDNSDQVSSVISDLLSYVETGTQGDSDKEKLKLLTQRMRGFLKDQESGKCDQSMVVDDTPNESIAETPPRFSRQCAKDQSLNGEEEFFNEVSETLKKIESKGMRSHRKPAPTAPSQ